MTLETKTEDGVEMFFLKIYYLVYGDITNGHERNTVRMMSLNAISGHWQTRLLTKLKCLLSKVVKLDHI